MKKDHHLIRDHLSEVTRSIRKPLELAFAPAYNDERIVFGAHMPGYGARSIPESVIRRWISFMKGKGIQQVCCLLPPSQLGYYMVDLLKVYEREFGEHNVFWAPIEDYHLCALSVLNRTLAFIKESDAAGEPVVIHCAGGRGRTGFIHAAWLVRARGFSVEQAIAAVKTMGRNPCEAVERGNASLAELYALLCTWEGQNQK